MNLNIVMSDLFVWPRWLTQTGH